MRIAGRERLEQFCRKHADARTWIEHWLADVETAVWATPQDLRNCYASASFLPEGVVIFNIKGNAYRLGRCVPHCHRVDSMGRNASRIRSAQ
jgi:mRNA interferase HigB